MARLVNNIIIGIIQLLIIANVIIEFTFDVTGIIRLVIASLVCIGTTYLGITVHKLERKLKRTRKNLVEVRRHHDSILYNFRTQTAKGRSHLPPRTFSNESPLSHYHTVYPSMPVTRILQSPKNYYPQLRNDRPVYATSTFHSLPFLPPKEGEGE